MKWVKILAKKPHWFLKQDKSTATHLQSRYDKGLRYEKRVGKWLKKKYPQTRWSTWYEFLDERGVDVRGKFKYCCTDYEIETEDRVLIVEVKYSQTDDAFDQLIKQYFPVVGFARQKPVIGVQICRVLKGRPHNPVLYLEELLEKPIQELNQLNTLHLTI